VNSLSIKLPDVGEGVTEAELVEWFVEVGDIVREDDIVAAVMTDKATVEIPSLYDGKVIERTGEVGDVLAIGSDLVRIETDAEGPDQAAPMESAPVVTEKPAPRPQPTPDPAPAPAPAPPGFARPPRP